MKRATDSAGPAAPPIRGGSEAALEARRDELLHGLGRAVRALRTHQGLSQQALAVRAGLSPRFVAQLEGGAGNISVAKLAEVARALGAHPAELLAAAEADGNGDAPGQGEAAQAAELRLKLAAALRGRSVAELRGLLAALRESQTPAGGMPWRERPIALLGLRGAGKSTLGPMLAGALGRRFVELDQAVQQDTGLAVSEIFELHGEDYYRDAERQALERILAGGEPLVVAVSGGAVTDGDVFRLLRERFLTVWVRATPEQHMARVAGQGDQRPMADRPNAMAELRDLLRARAPYYEQAQLVADTTTDTPEVCVLRLVAALDADSA